MDASTHARVLRLVAGMGPSVMKHAAALFNSIRSKVNKRGCKTEDVWLLATCTALVQKAIGGRDDIDIADIYEVFTNQRFDHKAVLSRELTCLAAADWTPVPGLLFLR